MVNTKPALKMLWKDFCTVIEYEKIQRDNKSTGHKETVALENQPCKLSFETLQTVNQSETAADVVQKAKLFISNEINIKEGSKIIVTHFGRVFEYQLSGMVGYFSSHQEIPLEPWKERA